MVYCDLNDKTVTGAMDAAERAAIKELHDDFLKNLHIDPEFLSPLIQEGVLEDSMVEDIQVSGCRYHIKSIKCLRVLHFTKGGIICGLRNRKSATANIFLVNTFKVNGNTF